MPEQDQRAERRRIPLPILLTPIVILAVVGTVADVIGPGLITERPLLQMFMNPRNRYLLLASPQVDTVPFFVVGFVRLVLTDPLFFLLGVQYGDAALRWAERKLDDDIGFIRTAERFFARFGSAIILIAPSGYLCLLAGATGMRTRRFVILNVAGTTGRLVLFRVLGETFKDELLSVLGFIQRYQWWLIALSLVVVAIQSRRKRSSGTLPSPSELEEEIEAVEDELTVERRKSQSPTAPPATPAAGSAPTESDG
jgi:membrane protein DedA with SNARE-associated domain